MHSRIELLLAPDTPRLVAVSIGAVSNPPFSVPKRTPRIQAIWPEDGSASTGRLSSM